MLRERTKDSGLEDFFDWLWGCSDEEIQGFRDVHRSQITSWFCKNTHRWLPQYFMKKYFFCRDSWKVRNFDYDRNQDQEKALPEQRRGVGLDGRVGQRAWVTAVWEVWGGRQLYLLPDLKKKKSCPLQIPKQKDENSEAAQWGIFLLWTSTHSCVAGTRYALHMVKCHSGTSAIQTQKKSPNTTTTAVLPVRWHPPPASQQTPT